MVACALGLPAAAGQARSPPALAAFSAAPGATPPAAWRLVTLPRLPQHTQYSVITLDGERVLRASSDGGYAALVHRVAADPAATALLRWRWRVDRFVAGADLTRKAGDDTAARVCVLFDLPLARVPWAERALIRLGRTLFDPDLPAATICYVWDAHLPAGTWLPNAYSDRVRMLVLRSGAAGQWLAEQRDPRADFARAFPHEAGNGPLPHLAAVAVAADADNTGAAALSYLGDIVLAPAAP